MPKKVENFKCAFDCLSDTHIASDQCIACQRRAFSNHNSMQFSTLSISVHWFSFIFCVLILQINFQWKKCFEGEKKNGSVLPAQLVQLCDYWLAFGFVFYKWTKSRSYFRWIEFHGLTLAQLNCHREIQYREKVMALDVFEGNTRESEWVRWKERVM